MEFVYPLKDHIIEEVSSDPFTLTCTLSRTPLEKVQWLKEGKPFALVKNNVKIEEDKNGTVHCIVFNPFTEDDVGNYSICVEKVSSSCSVQLKGMYV